MTTYVNFTPSASAVFSFQATLDSSLYAVTVPWNLFGQRYYVNIYDTSGSLIVSRPLVGSPLDYDISLTQGYFTTKLIYRQANVQFEIT